MPAVQGYGRPSVGPALPDHRRAHRGAGRHQAAAGQAADAGGAVHKRVRALNFSDLNEYVDNLFERIIFDSELTHSSMW